MDIRHALTFLSQPADRQKTLQTPKNAEKFSPKKNLIYE